MKKCCNKSTPGLTIAFIVGIGIFFFWQFSLQRKSISCGGDWSYSVHCPFGTYCRSLGISPGAGGLCTPFLPFFKIPTRTDRVYPTIGTTTSPMMFPTNSPFPTNTPQRKITITDPDLLYLRQINVTSGYEGVIFEFSPQKKAQATIRETKYGQDFGEPMTQLYELFSVEPADPEDKYLFAASRTINLKNYVGQRKTVYYREVISLIMSEQQLVLVDKVE